VPVPSLIRWPSSMAAGSCTPRGSNGLVRNVHVLEVRVFEARTGKLLSGRRFPSRAAVKSGAGMSFTTVFNWVSAESQTGFAGNAGGRKRPPPGGKLPTPAPADTANSAAPTLPRGSFPMFDDWFSTDPTARQSIPSRNAIA
jgi:hypothetical protein